MNTLYPVFLKLSKLQVVIIGGGFVGLEKLSFLLKSSPDANVTLIAPEINPEIVTLARSHKVELIREYYDPSQLQEADLIIAATNDKGVNIQIYEDGKANGTLVNVADTPSYCDFYLGGIVTKGNVKVAISTNGKSPTTAKRLRQFFEEVIPNDINALVENLNTYRKTIKGNFQNKVDRLNEITQELIENN